ncbi:MAG: hypothetical protein RLZZ136_816 [Pseudomonadota bacterium]
MNGTLSKSHSEVLNRLTAKQCECLELVLNHKTSKQIAQILNISPHTVNQRLDSARRILDVATRLDAAILYARLKGIPESFVSESESDALFAGISSDRIAGLSQRIVHEPFLLPETSAQPLSQGQPANDPVLHLAEAQPHEMLPPWEQSALLRPFAGPLAGTSETVRRLIMILGLSVLMMMLIIVGVAVGQTLTGLFGNS